MKWGMKQSSFKEFLQRGHFNLQDEKLFNAFEFLQFQKVSLLLYLLRDLN